VKRSLDKDITAALTGGQKDVAANLIGLKDQLNSQLVKAVPKFAYANGIAASFFRKENALDAGAEFAKAKGENAVFKRVIDKMTPPERELFKIGLGSKVASTVLESNDRRSIMNVIFKSPAERERLEMGMGEEDTKLLEAYLNVEEVFDNSRKAVMGNSTTAQQLSRMGKLGGPVSQIVGAGAGGALGGVPGAILGAIMGSVAKSVKAGVDEKVARMLGEKLASKDPAVYNLALKKVAGNPKIQRFIEGLSPQIISSALPTVMWQMKGWKIGTPPAPKPMKWPKPEATSPGPQHEDAAP
jgi:hypothetical protein